MAPDIRRLEDGSIDFEAYRHDAAQLLLTARTAMLRRLVAVLFGRRVDPAPAGVVAKKVLDAGLLIVNAFRPIKGRPRAAL